MPDAAAVKLRRLAPALFLVGCWVTGFLLVHYYLNRDTLGRDYLLAAAGAPLMVLAGYVGQTPALTDDAAGVFVWALMLMSWPLYGLAAGWVARRYANRADRKSSKPLRVPAAFAALSLPLLLALPFLLYALVPLAALAGAAWVVKRLL